MKNGLTSKHKLSPLLYSRLKAVVCTERVMLYNLNPILLS